MASDIARVYQQFDPARPLPPDDPRYVSCDDVRGEGDIVALLANDIRFADNPQHLLFAGHRGTGKSTELLRLRKQLSNHLMDDERFFVVYFEADDEDVDINDVGFPDLLLAMIRHVGKSMRELLNEELRPARLVSVLDGFLHKLKDIKVEAAQIDLKIAKLTATIKNSPDSRAKIREALEPSVSNLIDAANDLLDEAVLRLKSRGYRDLVIIVDNLDRIVLHPSADGQFNSHEQLFINRGTQLAALKCHVLYTLPISMVFSPNVQQLKNIFTSPCRTLPMVKVVDQQGADVAAGLQAMRDIVYRRLQAADVPKAAAIDTADTLTDLCRMSGGHLRTLHILLRSACVRLNDLPITRFAAEQAIGEMRVGMERALTRPDFFHTLKQIDETHVLPGSNLDEMLLYNQYVMEYLNGDVWYGVNPIVKMMSKFKSPPALPGSETGANGK